MRKRLEEVTAIFPKIRIFIENTMEEMRKSSWPSKDQLLESTLLVFVVFVALAAYCAGIDRILYLIVRYLISF